MKKSAIISNILITTALCFGLHTGVMAKDSVANATQSETAGEKINDVWIITKIKAKLATTTDLKSTDISVETNEGVATLTGTVTTKIELKKAIAVAESVKGVMKVDSAGLKVNMNN